MLGRVWDVSEKKKIVGSRLGLALRFPHHKPVILL